MKNIIDWSNPEEKRQYQRHYYLENKEKFKSAHKKWRDKNKDKWNEFSKDWKKENPEKFNEQKRRWEKRHPDKIAGYDSKPQRRFKHLLSAAKQRHIECTLSFENWKEIVKYDQCIYCSESLGKRGYGLDRKDNSKGYTLENSVPCCGSCNKIKNKYFTFEEMQVAMIAVMNLRRENH